MNNAAVAAESLYIYIYIGTIRAAFKRAHINRVVILKVNSQFKLFIEGSYFDISILQICKFNNNSLMLTERF